MFTLQFVSQLWKMRNVLVVLVLLCIGLSCGFIVPSGIREIIEDLNESPNSIENSDSKSRNMINNKTSNVTSVNITLTSELLTKSIKIHNKSSDNSLDKDLYENSNEKDATIEERSFIYIKQRGKKPYLKNVFELIPKSNFDNKALKSYVISHPSLDEISRRFLTGSIVGQDEYQSKVNNFINFHIETEPYQQIEKFSKQPGKYLELIKDPMIRPIVKTNEKDFISMENSLFNFTVGRKLLTDTQESLTSKSVINLKNDGHIENKTNDINYDRGQTVSEEGIYDDNLDHFINKVLENQILERKSNHVDHNGFHFCRDCLKKAKQTLKNRFEIESYCKCGRKKLIKIIGDDIVN